MTNEWPKYWLTTNDDQVVARALTPTDWGSWWSKKEEQWIPSDDNTPMIKYVEGSCPHYKAISVAEVSKITKESLVDNQWHFPSKGEFPDVGKEIEYSFNPKHRTICIISEGAVRQWKSSPESNAFCWRYCDPLPPVPTQEKEDDGFEEWFTHWNGHTFNANLNESRKVAAKAAWLASREALGKKETK